MDQQHRREYERSSRLLGLMTPALPLASSNLQQFALKDILWLVAALLLGTFGAILYLAADSTSGLIIACIVLLVGVGALAHAIIRTSNHTRSLT
jgi:hypothetical protein